MLMMVGVAQVVEHRVVAPVVEGSSPFTHPTCPFAPVAQLDRAPDFESVGRPFESGRACHNNFGKLGQVQQVLFFPLGRTSGRTNVSFPRQRASPGVL